MADRSLYNDIANKVTGSIGKKRLLLSQKEDGSEVSKPLEAEILLASNLDDVGSVSYNTTTMNINRAKFDISNDANSKAYNANLDDLHPNKARGVNVTTGTQAITAPYSAKYAIGQNSFAISVFGKINFPTTSSGTCPIGISDGANGSFGIFTSATAGVYNVRAIDSSGTTVQSGNFTFDQNKNQHHLLILDRINSKLNYFIDNVLKYSGSLAGFGSINNTSDLRLLYNGGTLRASGQLLRYDLINFAPTAIEAGYLWNNGRPDLFIVPDSWKWATSATVLTNGTFDTDTTGWVVGSNITDATITGGVLSFTGRGELATSTNQISQYITALETLNSKWLVKVRAKATTPGSKLYVKFGHSGGINLPAITLTDSYAEYYIEQSVNILASVTPGRFSFGAEDTKAVQIDSILLIKQGVIADYRASGMVQSLGATATTTVTAGVAYEITAAITAPEASTIGSQDTYVGTRFIAIAGTTLSGTGRVKPVIVSAINDDSTNALNATISGEPTLINMQVETVQGEGVQGTIVMSKYLDASAGANVGDTLFLPPKWFVSECILYNYGTGSASVKIGSTNGGGEYVSSKTITAGQVIKFSVPDTLDPYSLTDFSPFYLNSASWGSAKVKAEFRMTKSNNTW